MLNFKTFYPYLIEYRHHTCTRTNLWYEPKQLRWKPIILVTLLLFTLLISWFIAKLDHVEHLKLVLDILRKEKLFANLKSVCFVQTNLCFLVLLWRHKVFKLMRRRLKQYKSGNRLIQSAKGGAFMDGEFL